MLDEPKNIGEEYQRLSKEGFDAATRSFGEVSKGFQALAAEMTDYSKRTFDDVFRAWEQLLTAKSLDQPIGRMPRIDAQGQQQGVKRDLHNPGGGESIAHLPVGHAHNVNALRQALKQGRGGTAHPFP